MLKLADFLYYGSAGVQDFKQAERIYKLTSEGTTDSDVKGHALFKLGMMNQRGELGKSSGGADDSSGSKPDHDMAAYYYEQALK